MKLSKNPTGYVISNFEESSYWKDMMSILDCFVDGKYRIIFGLTEEYLNFTKSERCIKSEMFSFNAYDFLMHRLYFRTTGNPFSNYSMSKELKMLWFNAFTLEDIKNAHDIEHLFFFVVTEKEKNHNNYFCILNCIEMIEGNNLFITVKNIKRFDEEILPQFNKFMEIN